MPPLSTPTEQNIANAEGQITQEDLAKKMADAKDPYRGLADQGANPEEVEQASNDEADKVFQRETGREYPEAAAEVQVEADRSAEEARQTVREVGADVNTTTKVVEQTNGITPADLSDAKLAGKSFEDAAQKEIQTMKNAVQRVQEERGVVRGYDGRSTDETTFTKSTEESAVLENIQDIIFSEPDREKALAKIRQKEQDIRDDQRQIKQKFQAGKGSQEDREEFRLNKMRIAAYELYNRGSVNISKKSIGEEPNQKTAPEEQTKPLTNLELLQEKLTAAKAARDTAGAKGGDAKAKEKWVQLATAVETIQREINAEKEKISPRQAFKPESKADKNGPTKVSTEIPESTSEPVAPVVKPEEDPLASLPSLEDTMRQLREEQAPATTETDPVLAELSPIEETMAQATEGYSQKTEPPSDALETAAELAAEKIAPKAEQEKFSSAVAPAEAKPAGKVSDHDRWSEMLERSSDRLRELQTKKEKAEKDGDETACRIARESIDKEMVFHQSIQEKAAQTKQESAGSSVSDTEVVPAASKKELTVIQAELKDIPTAERKEIGLGFRNLGFRVQEGKSALFERSFNKLLKLFTGRDASKTDQPSSATEGTTVRFLESLAETFKKDKERAQKMMKDRDQSPSAMKRLQNVGFLSSNILKIGILTGSPLRAVMAGAQLFSRGAEAAKMARLKNADVLENNRLGPEKIEFTSEAVHEAYEKDEEYKKAVDEAYDIYESAKLSAVKQGTNVSTEMIEQAYLSRLPKDLLDRLTKVEPGKVMGAMEQIFQKVMRKQIELSIKMGGKFSKRGFEKRLKEFDGMVSKYGTVDALAMSAHYAEKTGKAVIAATAVESLHLLYKNLPHIAENLSLMGSAGKKTMESYFAGGSRPESTLGFGGSAPEILSPTTAVGGMKASEFGVVVGSGDSAGKAVETASVEQMSSPVRPEAVTSLVDEIRNVGIKHDSIWKSAHELVQKNADALGAKYPGPEGTKLSEVAWYNMKTSELVNEMNQKIPGGIKDLIHEGDQITLSRGPDAKFHLGLEETSGIKAGHLPHIEEVTKPEAVPVAPAVGTETPFSTFDAHQTEIAHSVNLPPQHGTDAEIAGIREANHLTEMEKKYGFESVNPPQAPKEGAVAAASEIVGAPLAVEAVASGAQKVVENSELGIKGVFQHAPDGKVSGISIEGEVGFAKANYLIDELGHHHQLNEHGMHNPAGFRQEADATIEIYKQQQLLKTLQEVGRGDSAEAAFLRNEIQHSVQSTEEKFGHIFKEEYVKDFKTVGHETQQSSAEQETIPGVHAAESTIKLQSDGISGNIHFKYDANGNPEELFYDQQGLLLTKATGREFVDSSKTFDLARQHYLSEHTFRDQLSRDGLNLITKNTRIYEELRHAGSHKEADFVRRIIEHNAEEMEQKFGTGVINQEKLSEALKK